MEPAGERREHSITPGMLNQGITVPQWSPPVNGGSADDGGMIPGLADTTAMEPAGERREHPLVEGLTIPNNTPQWSPPVTGGSTRRPAHPEQRHRHAAMEPTTEGWEHRRATDPAHRA